MSTEDLQRWASILRWGGFGITAIGLMITFASYYVADKLHVTQQVEKARAAARLADSENDLKNTKEKTAELQKLLAARQLSEEQRAQFVRDLADSPKGEIILVHVTVMPETVQFLEQVRSLVTSAGFTTPAKPEYAIGYTILTQPPWHMALILGDGEQPPYATHIKNALIALGIQPSIVVGNSEVSSAGQFKIYIGSKP